MSDSFDPYYKWFGIPPKDQPPNHYRLLGLELFEDDADVIESAADRQMAHLRSLQSGPHGALSQKLLNEVSAARLCLLDPAKRRAYDALLRSTTQAVPQHIMPSGSWAPPASAPDLPSTPPIAVTPVGSGAMQSASPAKVLPAEPVEDALPRKPFWQQPAIVAAAVAGLLLGTAAVGALMLLPLGKLAAEESYRDTIATARAAAADRIKAVSFAGVADDVPQTAATQVMNAEASVDSTANGSQSPPP